MVKFIKYFLLVLFLNSAGVMISFAQNFLDMQNSPNGGKTASSGALSPAAFAKQTQDILAAQHRAFATTLKQQIATIPPAQPSDSAGHAPSSVSYQPPKPITASPPPSTPPPATSTFTGFGSAPSSNQNKSQGSGWDVKY